MIPFIIALLSSDQVTTQALKANCDVPLAKMVLALRFNLVAFLMLLDGLMTYFSLCQVCFTLSSSSLHVIATLYCL